MDSGNRELQEAVQNLLFDRPGPRSIPAKRDPEHKFISTLLTGVVEIDKAYQTIQDAQEYFRHYPRGMPENQRSKYLAFVIHAYLNGVYVLEQRLQTYPTKLARAASKTSEVRTNIEKLSPGLKRIVTRAFGQIRIARGAHVHEQRFSDPSIESLATLELVSRGGKLPLYDSLCRHQLRSVRRQWDERFVVNRRGTDGLLDTYYEGLLGAITHPNGQLKIFCG